VGVLTCMHVVTEMLFDSEPAFCDNAKQCRLRLLFTVRMDSAPSSEQIQGEDS
jgi:hypothetical protein